MVNLVEKFMVGLLIVCAIPIIILGFIALGAHPPGKHESFIVANYCFGFVCAISGLFLATVTIPFVWCNIRKLFTRTNNNNATVNAIVALLSDSQAWKSDGMGYLEHTTRLTLHCEKDKVRALGLFTCDFNQAESYKILKYVDLMRSAKLTSNMSQYTLEAKEIAPMDSIVQRKIEKLTES